MVKGLKQTGQSNISNISAGKYGVVLPALPDRMALSAGKDELASEDIAIIQLFLLYSLYFRIQRQ